MQEILSLSHIFIKITSNEGSYLMGSIGLLDWK